MMGKALFCLLLLFASFTTCVAQFTFDVEGNIILGIPYNTVRIPAVGGIQFDLNNDLETSTKFTYRLRLSYTIADRHVISALAAPLIIRSSGSFNQDIQYSGALFAANETVDALYKFNSYRLTYRYLIVNSDYIQLGAGITGKIRDANIVLSDGTKEADYPDLGFVPLINFYFRWWATDRLNVLLEGDALASRQGRAEDVFAGVAYALSEEVSVKAGYRLLEGGADVEDNYNFTFINYAAFGLLLQL